ncbi:hypothetical protein [Sphingomonas flavescens]|jgi:hypothetical protein|uniref:hypothetical protein n=1 Tax=Sphingomonas flavescens TaxID=3132797 RepID=UPI002803C9F0|nr:hypothetical protein [Sphingomonas limnosediminicola]
METASTYFTRRAREERTSALDAASSEARTAHLEMALRLVKVATEPANGLREINALYGHNDNARDDLGHSLRSAFPVVRSDEFQELLDAVDS